MSILVLGQNGQVGQALAKFLPDKDSIFWSRGDFNFCNLDNFENKIKCVSPRVIINAAGYTEVDQAEEQPDLADQINHLAVARLADLAYKMQIRLIHFSTDYVFDGEKSGFYNEEDSTNPLSVYGATKLNAEKAIQDSGCQYNIFRISWVISPNGQNFVKKILTKATRANEFSVVEDQIGAPTSAEYISQIVNEAISANLADGVYHLASKGYTSWYGLATFILQLADASMFKLKSDKITLIPARTRDLQQKARRPENSRLSCEKLFSRLKIDQTSWEEQVRQVVGGIVRNA